VPDTVSLMSAGSDTGSVTAGSSGDVDGAGGDALPDPVGVGVGAVAATVGEADAVEELTFGTSTRGADDVDEHPRSALVRTTTPMTGPRR
jgi:hypothetical protein